MRAVHAVSMRIGFLSACLVGSSLVQGAGFELPQKGTKELAIAYGGSAALLQDASAIANNPAGLMRLQGRNLVGAATFIKSSFDYDHQIHRELIPGVGGQVPGNSQGNISGMSMAPHIYYSRRMSENMAMGFGIYAPFGSQTDYGDEWAGRYHATSTEFRAVNFNPVFAWKESDRLSFGLGAIIQIFNGEFKSKIDVGHVVADQVIKKLESETLAELREGASDYAACPFPGMSANACVSHILSHKFDVDNTMTVSSLAYGFNFGVLWEHDEKTRVGFNYQSRVRHLATGDAKRPETEDPQFKARLQAAIESVGLKVLGVTIPSWFEALFGFGGNIGTLSGDSAVEGAEKAVGPLGAQGGDIELQITMPDVVTISGFHQYDDEWAFTGGITWTKWDYVKELRFSYADSTHRGGENYEGNDNDVRRRDLVVPFAWENTFRLGFGTVYTGFDRFTLYGGMAFDQSPVPDAARRSPRGPDSDRLIMSVGASTKLFNRVGVDVGYSHTHFLSSDINSVENPAGTYHRMDGSYKGSLNVLSVQASYQF